MRVYLNYEQILGLNEKFRPMRELLDPCWNHISQLLGRHLDSVFISVALIEWPVLVLLVHPL